MIPKFILPNFGNFLITSSGNKYNTGLNLIWGCQAPDRVRLRDGRSVRLYIFVIRSTGIIETVQLLKYFPSDFKRALVPISAICLLTNVQMMPKDHLMMFKKVKFD